MDDDVAVASKLTDREQQLVAAMRELRDSVDELDPRVSGALEAGAGSLPKEARQAIRRHGQAWKRFQALRKERFGGGDDVDFGDSDGDPVAPPND